jgi:hypothetical protein
MVPPRGTGPQGPPQGRTTPGTGTLVLREDVPLDVRRPQQADQHDDIPLGEDRHHLRAGIRNARALTPPASCYCRVQPYGDRYSRTGRLSR